MTLYTGCIYRNEHHGLRISIMNRHTLADGITPDPKITAQSYDRWEKSVAPSSLLLGDYYKRGLQWEEFERQYLLHIQKPELARKLLNLLNLPHHKILLLVYVEKKHRRDAIEDCWRRNVKG